MKDKSLEELTYMLRLVFTEAELRSIVARASAQRAIEAGDHQSLVLGRFIMAAEAVYTPRPQDNAPPANGPDLADLQRRFLGPDRK